jgi:hypothetical protein
LEKREQSGEEEPERQLIFVLLRSRAATPERINERTDDSTHYNHSTSERWLASSGHAGRAMARTFVSHVAFTQRAVLAWFRAQIDALFLRLCLYRFSKLPQNLPRQQERFAQLLFG